MPHAPFRVKVAETDVAVCTSTTQVGSVPAHPPPLQPLNLAFFLGAAVSVTEVPRG